MGRLEHPHRLECDRHVGAESELFNIGPVLRRRCQAPQQPCRGRQGNGTPRLVPNDSERDASPVRDRASARSLVLPEPGSPRTIAAAGPAELAATVSAIASSSAVLPTNTFISGPMEHASSRLRLRASRAGDPGFSHPRCRHADDRRMLRPHRVHVPTTICAKRATWASSSRCALGAGPANRRSVDAVARSSNRQRTAGTRRVRQLEHVRSRAALPTRAERPICRTNVIASDRACTPLPPQNFHGKEGSRTVASAVPLEWS